MEEIKKYIKIVESRGVLGAEDGGLTLFINDENIELGKTPEEVAEKLKGIQDLDLDDLFASSSVDFADEYGFDNEDDAHELFDKAIALMVPKPDDRARDKVDDRPATSDDIAKINKGEEIEEAVGEYSYTLEYNGEGPSGYTKHILTITSPEGESKKVADDFTYFEPEEQDMQAELESWFKNGHGVGDEQEESIEEGHCDVCGDGSDEMGPPEAEEQESHKYEKHHSTNTGSVSVEASAESIDELKVLLRKVGITLPSGEPHGDDDHDSDKEPMKVISLSPEPEMDGDKPTMDFPKTDVNPDSKEVLTNILKDKLKDYLRNGK